MAPVARGVPLPRAAVHVAARVGRPAGPPRSSPAPSSARSTSAPRPSASSCRSRCSASGCASSTRGRDRCIHASRCTREQRDRVRRDAGLDVADPPARRRRDGRVAAHRPGIGRALGTASAGARPRIPGAQACVPARVVSYDPPPPCADAVSSPLAHRRRRRPRGEPRPPRRRRTLRPTAPSLHIVTETRRRQAGDDPRGHPLPRARDRQAVRRRASRSRVTMHRRGRTIRHQDAHRPPGRDRRPGPHRLRADARPGQIEVRAASGAARRAGGADRGAPAATSRPGSRGRAVRALQDRLKALGYVDRRSTASTTGAPRARCSRSARSPAWRAPPSADETFFRALAAGKGALQRALSRATAATSRPTSRVRCSR